MIEIRETPEFSSWLDGLKDERAVARIQIGKVLVILLCGGDKASQGRDIERAMLLAKEI